MVGIQFNEEERNRLFIQSTANLEVYQSEEDIKKFQNTPFKNDSELLLLYFIERYSEQVVKLPKGDYNAFIIILAKIIRLSNGAVQNREFQLSEDTMSMIINDLLKSTDFEPDQKKIDKKRGRGRKGTKIRDAYNSITHEPVNLNQFLEKHDVSENIMKQHSRFDPFPERGKVRTRSVGGVKMIWRDQPTDEDQLYI